MNFDKTSGQHWLWGANTKVDSENFESNDYAQLNGADGWLSNANLRYRETQPGKVFRNYYVQLDAQTDTTLRQLMQTGHVRGTVNVTWVNFWTSQVQFSRNLATESVSLTRGGPLMGRGPGWTTNINVGNRAASRTRLTGNVFYQTNDDGASNTRVQGTVLNASRPAVAVLGVAVLRPHHRAAAVRQHAPRRPPGDVRQPLRVCVHRSQHDVDGVSARPDDQAGREPGYLCRAVRGVRTLLRLRRTAGAREPRSIEVRHRRHDPDGESRTAARW